MSNDVTPIRDGCEPSPATPRKHRARRPASPRFSLDEPVEGPSCMRLIQAVRGVCDAMEQLAESRDPDVRLNLATAGAILSDMLQDRISWK